MKAAFVVDPLYVRKLNISDATLAELAGPVVAGDKLYDPAFGQEYEVVARGFPPSRSYATAERLVWSHETVAGFRGQCTEINGRLLVDKSLLSYDWTILTCSIQKKSGGLPIGIPIVGRFATGMDLGYCVGVIREGGVSEMVAGLPDRQLVTGETFEFRCQAPHGAVIDARLFINESANVPMTGTILSWDSEDYECTVI